MIIDADIAHLGGIADIYNHAVRTSTAIWNEVEVDVANRQEWLTARRTLGYPVLVFLDGDGAVLGYASFGDWRAFDGYRFTVEHSVYVRQDQRGRGIGEALMVELMARARRLGKHVMVAGIEAQNIPSIRLHEKLGFEQAGTVKEVGTKFGTWLDLTFMQLRLDDRARPEA